MGVSTHSVPYGNRPWVPSLSTEMRDVLRSTPAARWPPSYGVAASSSDCTITVFGAPLPPGWEGMEVWAGQYMHSDGPISTPIHGALRPRSSTHEVQ